ncbi:MAG: response regulator [Eubacteriales bacterium]|nr:response regulator [Eubacteriales bacterium]
MNNTTIVRNNKRHIWLLEAAVGLIIMAAVFIIAINVDITATENELSDKAQYINEQCNSFTRLNLAAETKSLMRVIESAQQINRNITYERELSTNDIFTEEFLKKNMEECYLTAVIILDARGGLTAQYYTDEFGADVLSEYLDSVSLVDVVDNPQKTYATRIACVDGSYVDLAACGMSDGDGIVVTYYHTSEEYVNNYNLSFTHILSGYDDSKDGIVVVTNGNRIIASNDENMVGNNVDNYNVLKKIKSTGVSGKLVQSTNDNMGPGHDFGLMERGRDYYVYAYMPERSVFRTTPRNMLYTFIVYMSVVAVLNMMSWKTAQEYEREQFAMQQRYAVSLQEKNEQLQEAVRREERANAAKTDFLSRMTHDIRTPLNGIIGLLRIDETHKDNIAMINANRQKMSIAANHLLSLINDILQMSKLEDGDIELAREVVDLNQLAKDIITIVEQRAADAGVNLDYDKALGKAVHPYVYGSPLHLRQLFLNIYGNCIKYNKIGGMVRTCFNCIGEQNGIVTYEWTISDTGIGMSEEFLEHIFEPFVQEKADARSIYQGTGLGMAIVKNLVDKMNGTINVTSKEGEGSTFVIRIPFEIAGTIDNSDSVKEEHKADITGINILLAEDNELNAEIAQTLLEDEGAHVKVVCDGEQAVSEFSGCAPHTYDVILMDIMMPKLDGLSATRKIRALERPDAATIPIIAMTANAFQEDARKCIEAGMNAHLSKPLQMDVVVDTIEEYYKR